MSTESSGKQGEDKERKWKFITVTALVILVVCLALYGAMVYEIWDTTKQVWLNPLDFPEAHELVVKQMRIRSIRTAVANYNAAVSQAIGGVRELGGGYYYVPYPTQMLYIDYYRSPEGGSLQFLPDWRSPEAQEMFENLRGRYLTEVVRVVSKNPEAMVCLVGQMTLDTKKKDPTGGLPTIDGFLVGGCTY